uniref:Uncharacterized protein n=1 Tax=mine drainage metagenome TaxID=410659 RepID=E6QM69_9ZZZZ
MSDLAQRNKDIVERFFKECRIYGFHTIMRTREERRDYAEGDSSICPSRAVCRSARGVVFCTAADEPWRSAGAGEHG